MEGDIKDHLERINDKLDVVSDTCYKIDKEVALQKAAFDDHMKQDEKMYEQFKRMNDILQQNTESLKEHIHRTELLENIAAKMDKRLTPIELKHMEQEIISKFQAERKDKAISAIILIAKVATGVSAGIAIAIALRNMLGK